MESPNNIGRKQIELAMQKNGIKAELDKMRYTINKNAPDYASCPYCKHYNALMPTDYFCEQTQTYVHFTVCRDCSNAVMTNETDEANEKFYNLVEELSTTKPASEQTEKKSHNKTMKNEKLLKANQEKMMLSQDDKLQEMIEAGFKKGDSKEIITTDWVNGFVEELNETLNAQLTEKEPVLAFEAWLAKIKTNKDAMFVAMSIILGTLPKKSDVKITNLTNAVQGEFYRLHYSESDEKFDYKPLEKPEHKPKIGDEITTLAEMSKRQEIAYTKEAKKVSVATIGNIFGTTVSVFKLFSGMLFDRTKDLPKGDEGKWTAQLEAFVLTLIGYSQGETDADGKAKPFTVSDKELAIYDQCSYKTISTRRNGLARFQDSFGAGLVEMKQTKHTTDGGTIYTLTIVDFLSTLAHSFIENGQATSLLLVKSASNSADFLTQVKALPEADQESIQKVRDSIAPVFEKLPEPTTTIRDSAKISRKKAQETADALAKQKADREKKALERKAEEEKALKPIQEAIEKAKASGNIELVATRKKEYYRAANKTANLANETASSKLNQVFSELKSKMVEFAVLCDKMQATNPKEIAQMKKQLKSELDALTK